MIRELPVLQSFSECMGGQAMTTCRCSLFNAVSKRVGIAGSSRGLRQVSIAIQATARHSIPMLAVVIVGAAATLIGGRAEALVVWSEALFKLAASDAAASDAFGNFAAISGKTAIVGAPYDDNPAVNSGSAYLFDVTTGQQLFKLAERSGGTEEYFGWSVGISGGTAIISAPGDDGTGSALLFDAMTGRRLFKLTAAGGVLGDNFGNDVGIDGNLAVVASVFDDQQGSDAGAAYLFDVTTGQQLFKLTAADGAPNDAFGNYVDISGNVIIVGAPFHDALGTDTGAAYLFNAATGQQLHKLTASDAFAGDRFGRSVSVHGDTAVVGAPFKFNADAGYSSGAAYVFDVTTGEQLFKIAASDAATSDFFGWSVELDDGVAIIGAPGDDNSSGSAYLVDLATGQELVKYVAADGAIFDNFGNDVGISGNLAIVTAVFDDSRAPDAGAAYVFQVVPEPLPLALLVMSVPAIYLSSRRLPALLHCPKSVRPSNRLVSRGPQFEPQ